MRCGAGTAAALVLFFTGTLCAGEPGVAYGERVPVRRRPDAEAPVAAWCPTGCLLQVRGRTGARDRLGSDPWGYHWFRVELDSGAFGWVYGESLYLIGSGDHRENDAVFIQGSPAGGSVPLSLDGETCLFAVAVETSRPVMDGEGLSGSSVHGLPVVYREGEQWASPLLVQVDDVPGILFREGEGPRFWFRLVSGPGLNEQVTGVDVVERPAGEAIRITVRYTAQEGGGSYRLTAVPAGDRMEVVDFEHVSGTPY
ncbi:MAG: hypothetical protein ACOC8N_02600 [Spirochaetota bacterium]